MSTRTGRRRTLLVAPGRGVAALALIAATMLVATPGPAWSQQRKACIDCHQDFKKVLSSKFVHSPAKQNCETCHMRHGFTQKLVLTKKLPDLCVECHAGVQKELASANVHGALSKGGCTTCHDFLIAGEGGKSVCLTCHENLAADMASPDAHSPFKKGDCAACHAPHSSERPHLLVADEAQTCEGCHKNALSKHKNIPGVADLACSECHDPHLASKKTKLASSAHPPFAEGDCASCHTIKDGAVEIADDFPPSDLCQSCHDDVATVLAGEQSHFGADPVKQGGTATCLKCHEAHRSSVDGQLVRTQNDLCRSCHESLAQPAGFKGKVHAPFAEGKCTACHEPHGGGSAHHLAKTGKELCASCHADIVAPAKAGEVHHEALDTDDCLDCHAGHASEQVALLKKPVGETCADCHEKSRFAHEHPPYLTSNCESCHSNHARTPKLLAAPVNKACGACHKEQLDALSATFPHAVAKEEDCTSCHAPHGSANPGLLAEPQKDLCSACHELGDLAVRPGADASAPVQFHAPVTEGRCSGCHDAHGGSRKNLLTRDQDNLCYGCHTTEKVAFAEGTQHSPVAQGRCDVCHSPHGSTSAALRTRIEPDLCTQCHDFTKPPLQGSHQGFDVSQTNCTSCHSPHNSKEKHLLNPVVHPPFAEGDCESCHEGGKTESGKMAAVAADACLACHDEKSSGTGHQHVAGVSCINCHEPHSSRNASLLIDPARLCQSCHQDVVQAKRADNGVHLHQPVQEGRCLDCHQLHEPAAPKYLAKTQQDLCSSCHASIAARTKDRTQHDPFRKGNCAACHEVHASSQEHLLKKAEGNLCTSCHGLTTPKMTSAHKRVPLSGDRCTTCHDPHSTQPAGSKLVYPNRHEPFKEKECDVCHDAAGKVTATAATCAECHDNAKEFQHVHNAGRAGDRSGELVCLDCHSPHAGYTSLMVRPTETQTCMQCHDRREFTRKTVHAALDEGCTTCHDLHDTDALVPRGAGINDKCSDCHDAEKTHAHPTGGALKDPRTNLQLTCASCHEPHSSDVEHMLTFDQKRDLCLQCHAGSALTAP